MIYTHSALRAHLIKSANGIPIAWENVKFEPDNTKPYLEAFFVPAGSEALTIGYGGFNEGVGFYQVNVHTPLDSGTSENDELCTKLSEDFEIGEVLISNERRVTMTSQAQKTVPSSPPSMFTRVLTFNFSSLKQRKIKPW